MSLRVYNTLSREKEPFAPLRDGHVGIYLCGPTVYKPPHLGHLVGPVIFDTIKRYLTFKGYRVNWVVNVTDVDDKIIIEADRRGITFKALAEEQTALYMTVLDRLNVRSNIDHFPRASEHMPDIVAMIQTLIAKGHAYAPGGGDVWFDTASDADYGKLSNRKLADQEAGLRDLAGQGKKLPSDFALWKATKPGEPSWPSPWGNGRPGWHIECSAMSAKYLGNTFDIHGGGDDLKFPHHENELAQSECAHGGTFVKYWLHNGLTKVKTKAASGEWKSEKMSKSLGNVMDAADLLDTHGPDVLRYLLLSTHYRSPIEFSDEALDNTKKAIGVFSRLLERTSRLRQVAASDDSALAQPFEDKFVVSMDDDFNTAGAIAALHEMAGAINGEIERSGVENAADPSSVAVVLAAAGRFKFLAGLLGLTFAPPEKKKDDGLTDPLMQLIIRLRAEARKRKDFATADAIRDGLNELKITLEDKKDGTVWRQG
ncbi:MAG TPA: cysteine--tRNA ligase [Tepidisphaeraceae bacterium]|jgi:cysteinyl-tRNA synthetase